MGRLIPGRVRNEGIALYEQGMITQVDLNTPVLEATIEGEELVYALDDSQVSCTCTLFKQKNYCQHLAAFEHYLKNDTEGKDFLDKLENGEEPEAPDTEKTFSHLFLDNLVDLDDNVTRFNIEAVAKEEPFASEIWWTLKLRRVASQQSYIIRDIRAFLRTVKKGGYYQIGKSYFEPIPYGQFDEASQRLLDFLWKLLPEDEQYKGSEHLTSQGRYLNFGSGFLQEGFAYLQDLVSCSFDSFLADDLFTMDELTGDAGVFTFDVIMDTDEITLMIKERDFSTLYHGNFLRLGPNYYHLNWRQQELVKAIGSLPLEDRFTRKLTFSYAEQARLSMVLSDFATIGKVNAPESLAIQDFTPIFNLNLLEDDVVTLKLQFAYDGGTIVGSRDEISALPFSSDYRHEVHVLGVLENLNFGPFFDSRLYLRSTEDVYRLFTRTIPLLEKEGTVHLSQSMQDLQLVETANIDVQVEGGFLDVSFDFSHLQQEDIDAAVEALMANDAYFVNHVGKVIVFDEETQKVSQVLQNLRSANMSDDGHIRLNRVEAYQLSDTLSHSSNVHFSEQFNQLARDLRHPEEFALPDLSVQADLRDYQQLGVRWLSMLDYYGFGGILADDMGLGKTLQTIAFLSSKVTDESRVLILAPSSLIFNWKDEFTKFAPDLEVEVVYGNKAVRDSLIDQAPQVIITSYASFRQDYDKYSQDKFDYLILDEAQAIKNAQTKIAQHLRDFKVDHCFALSGTPIENKLSEIWSIFQIVLPGLLPSRLSFLSLSPEQVSRYIRPFILRRRKEEVLPELPDLIETTYLNELADSQKAIYLAQLQQMQDSLAGASNQEFNRRKIEILSGITRLRQICNSPSLFMPYSGESGKLDSLRELLEQLKTSDRRALIFSQFRGMLDLAEETLSELGLTSYKLTGSTPSKARQDMTIAFNKGARDAFLISLKAGGVGLNLTGADTVILIDLWWNPAVEMQAISRAHRLGQSKTVEVYRLITRGTIEEKILELQESKKQLISTVLESGEDRSNMTIDDIKDILGLTD